MLSACRTNSAPEPHWRRLAIVLVLGVLGAILALNLREAHQAAASACAANSIHPWAIRSISALSVGFVDFLASFTASAALRGKQPRLSGAYHRPRQEPSKLATDGRTLRTS